MTVVQPAEAGSFLAFCQVSFSLRSLRQCGQMFACLEMVSRHSGQWADPPSCETYFLKTLIFYTFAGVMLSTLSTILLAVGSCSSSMAGA